MVENQIAVDGRFYINLQQNLRLYEGCGNMIGIVPLTLAGYPEDADFRQDRELRRFLAQWGREIRSDSVCVLTGNPVDHALQGYHFNMTVFEPSGDANDGLEGGLSTMCGNGVRAVAAFIRTFDPTVQEARIMTDSGLRRVGIRGDLYSVDMGELTTARDDLRRYISADGVIGTDSNGRYIDSPVAEPIARALDRFHPVKGWKRSWSIGLTGDRNPDGDIDGEPHLVMEITDASYREPVVLGSLAESMGPDITKKGVYFPFEMNANFYSLRGFSDRVLEIVLATHERNLGDDPHHSVTAACGTGSTVVGGLLLTRYPDLDTVRVINRGGVLEITRKPGTANELIMTGPANEVQLV
ncbi:hypothetical protein HYS93_03925 [Candidatus Daviesbacteria bacterium]|nr:hypothetical protein [Candidatus Daviesbacteria bacterium]